MVPGVTDHDDVLTTICLNAVHTLCKQHKIRDMRRANWLALNDALAKRLSEVQLDDIDNAWANWKLIVSECVDQHVPKNRMKGGKRRLLSWLTKNEKEIIDVRNRLFSHWRETKQRVATEAFLAARRSSQAALRTARCAVPQRAPTCSGDTSTRSHRPQRRSEF
jgi:hypothetical protein